MIMQIVILELNKYIVPFNQVSADIHIYINGS